MPVPVWNSYQTLPSLVSVGSCDERSPVSAQVPPLEEELELLDELEEEELLELEDDEEELEELDDELDDELLVVLAYEHHAEAGKLLDGKFELEHATLFVKVP